MASAVLLVATEVYSSCAAWCARRRNTPVILVLHNVGIHRVIVDLHRGNVGVSFECDGCGETSRPREAVAPQLSRLEETAGVLGGDLARGAVVHLDGSNRATGKLYAERLPTWFHRNS